MYYSFVLQTYNQNYIVHKKSFSGEHFQLIDTVGVLAT